MLEELKKRKILEIEVKETFRNSSCYLKILRFSQNKLKSVANVKVFRLFTSAY